jgi:exodeoxyribonuclease V beta subunit
VSTLRAQLAVLTPGTHVLEASAGTGKTWTITTLVAAALALGRVTPSRVLAVTFTRAATAELRVKVRERLAELAALLASSRDDDDTVRVLLEAELATGVHGDLADATATDAARRTLRARLLDALADADAIGVDTMHGWCATLLGQFGDLLGLEPPRSDASTVLPPADELTERGALAAATGAPVAQWIGFARRIATTDGLTQVARALLAGIADVQLMRDDGSTPAMDAAAVADARTLCARVEAMHARLARQWASDVEAIEAQLRAAMTQGQLSGTKWRLDWLAKRASSVSRLVSDITAYFTLSKDDVKQLAYFGARELAAATKKGQPAVSLGTFSTEIDALLDLLPEVRTALAMPLGAFVDAVREALPRRAEDFDDLLRLVAEGLEREPTVARRVRAATDLVLIDESQDTDPLQWRIFATLFHQTGERKRLILVGDPKQSIYRFRNAEVAVYLAARAEATSPVLTLDTNWRSDPALVRAVNTIYDAAGSVFGAGVTFQPVHAARTAPQLLPATPTPLTFVAMPADVGAAPASRARALVADDVARRIAAVLRAPAAQRLQLPDGHGGVRAVEARDCAVLVSANAHAHLIVQALRAVGVHAVAASRQAVTQGATALELASVLRALEDPGDRAALREAALTALVRPALGLDLHDPPAVILEALDGDAGRRFDDALRAARSRWYTRGVMDAWITLDRALALTWHAATHPDAERRLTDVRHLLELLAAHETQQRATPTDSLRWLAERLAERSVDQLTAEELEERLESDEDAVRVLTMHASKGLEFPLVWIPFAWSMRPNVRISPQAPLVRRYDPARGAVIGIVPVGSTSLADHPVVRDESDALALEQQRLLYVALTRARHRCVVHVSDVERHATSALGQLLGATSAKDGSGQSLVQRARALAGPGTGIVVESMDDAAPTYASRAYRTEDAPSTDIAAREWTRSAPLDTLWRRGSFTALTQRALPTTSVAAGGVGLTAARRTDLVAHSARTRDLLEEFEAADDVREPAADEGDERRAPPLLIADADGRALEEATDTVPVSPRVPLADFPRGRAAGNALHDVFERAVHARFSAPSMAEYVPDALERQGLDAARWASPLAAALDAAVDVPLIGLGATGDRGAGTHWPTLRTLTMDRTFTELSFDFAVAQARPPAERDALIRARHLAQIFRDHPGGAVTTEYADAIASLDFLPLRGLLTGAIDLVARHAGRWYLLDYKSNHLGDTVSDYDHVGMTASMHAHHYVLQYHLYLVALQRLLRLRLPAYEYDAHIGGVGYVFVRGLDAAHPGAGVFADRPPRARIDALDTLLRHGATT